MGDMSPALPEDHGYGSAMGGEAFFTGRAGRGRVLICRAGKSPLRVGQGQAGSGQGRRTYCDGAPIPDWSATGTFLGHPVDYYFSQCRHCSLRCFEM